MIFDYGTVPAKSLQLHPTLCNLMDHRPPKLLCPWDSPGKNTGVGSYSLLQGIFPTQRWYLGQSLVFITVNIN